jgi:hypothetical protein
MDEFKLLGDMFAEPPPPSPEVIAAARARLPLNQPPRRAALRRAAARREAPRREAPSRAALRRRIRPRVALPVAAIAAAAAAAVVVTTLVAAPGHQAPGHQQSGPAVYHFPAGARATAGSAAAGRKILLTVAGTVAQAPSPTRPAPGRYFVSKTLVGNFLTVGPPRDRYVILERSANQSWSGRKSMAPSPDLVRLLAIQFASAADQAAWRRDGSPGKWDVTADTSLADPHGEAEGFDSDITISPGKLTESSETFGAPKQFLIGHDALTAAQLLKLPADPARLKALILENYNTGESGEGVDREAYLFQVTPTLLTLPVSSAVRSALYRMLADLPGVRSLGQVQDAAGQDGVGVALDRSYSPCGAEAIKYRNGGVNSAVPVFRSCVVEWRLIINPQTGLPLDQELRYVKLSSGYKWPGPDGLFSYQIFQRAYWTNASPPVATGRG